MPDTQFLTECLRWYGPDDPVTLDFLRQAGAEGVFTSLHHLAYGEPWSEAEIRRRKELVEGAGLRWVAVESVPVHEDVKRGAPGHERYLEAYVTTLRNLGTAGIDLVVYNFMPVLDWVRTDLAHRLPDGKECLRYDPVQFAAFDVCALDRPGAEADHSPEVVAAAREQWADLDEAARGAFVRGLIDSFPGTKLGLDLDDVRRMIEGYAGIDRAGLKERLQRFLQAVVPAAEAAGVRLAIHPDDPPFPILGLPRVVSTAEDVADLLGFVDSPAHGVCFCCGSFGGRRDNDLPAMVRAHGDRIHATHLRAVTHCPDGSFHEADHLDGDADLAAITALLMDEQARRGPGARIAFRPDHGHVMADDLAKPRPPNPGYSYLGRMRGLAELRGVMHGIRAARAAKT